ncbi:MAG: hypothetical protein ACLRZH_03540 [Ruthenibacterium lactatiformans]
MKEALQTSAKRGRVIAQAAGCRRGRTARALSGQEGRLTAI